MTKDEIMNTSKSILPALTSYWCHFATPTKEERFFWSVEHVREACGKIGPAARSWLIALAESAPTEEAATYLAADTLEDYVDLVVKQGDAQEANFLIRDNRLGKLLSDVWGDVAQLPALAAAANKYVVKATYSEPPNFSPLSLKDVAGFWCYLYANTPIAYKSHHDTVMARLGDRKHGHTAVEALLASAPDERAKQHLQKQLL